MARQSIQPEGIPKPITPSDSPATDPMDQGDGVAAAQPRPAASGGADRAAAGAEPKPVAGDSGLPGRQPSDAAPPVDDEGPLESLGKAISAPVREAGRSSSDGRGGAPR